MSSCAELKTKYLHRERGEIENENVKLVASARNWNLIKTSYRVSFDSVDHKIMRRAMMNREVSEKKLEEFQAAVN